MTEQKELLKENGIERRYLPIEMRVDDEGRINGYAAVFGQWSQPLGFFKEKIRKGAFKKTIEQADVRALFNHDPNYVLGRNTADTLELVEDKKGLRFEVAPPATQWANDLQVSVKRGDINQASFGFEAIRDEWDHKAEPMERELIEVRLFDVSVVTYPAYTQTKVSARSLANMFLAKVQKSGNQEEIRLLLEQLDQLIDSFAPGKDPHPDEDLAAKELSRARAMIRKRKLELQRLNLI